MSNPSKLGHLIYILMIKLTSFIYYMDYLLHFYSLKTKLDNFED